MPSAASSPPPPHRAFVLERTFGPLPKKRQAALGRGLRATARAYPDSIFHWKHSPCSGFFAQC
jgi:hypothetical protein